MKSVLFHPEAEEEMLAAAQFYQERAEGLGARFLTAVREAVERISLHPKASQVIHGRGVRGGAVRTFPYSVLYVERTADILVLAVMHHRRRPSYWRERLS